MVGPVALLVLVLTLGGINYDLLCQGKNCPGCDRQPDRDVANSFHVFSFLH